MLTSFCEQLAVDLNEIEVPVFIENLAYWIRKNAANKKNLHGDRYWSYNSRSAFLELFPFWSAKTIRNIIKRAVNYGLILVGNFNKAKFDKTNWYALTDKGLSYFPALHHLIQKPLQPTVCALAQKGQRSAEKGQPIPKETTTKDLKDNNNISDLKENPVTGKERISTNEIVEAYHEVLPDSPKMKVIDDKLKRQLQTMVKNWPKYSPSQSKFSIDSFKKFLTQIKLQHPRFIEPYKTKGGNYKRNNLRNITREINIARFINGEFNFN